MHLAAEHVHVVIQRVGRREGRCLRESDSLVHLHTRSLVDLRACGGVEDPLTLQQIAEHGDRVALAPVGDLLLGAIILGVGHRVAAEAVGDGLDEHRPALLAYPTQRLAEHRMGVEHVHPVTAHPGDAEALALALQVGDGGVTTQRGAHPELVVGDHEHDRQAPQRGEVERLAESALVGGAVAERAERDVVLAAVVARQRDARRDRQIAADDPVAAHEAAPQVEHVHRAAPPAGAAVHAPEQLRHHVARAASRAPARARASGRSRSGSRSRAAPARRRRSWPPRRSRGAGSRRLWRARTSRRRAPRSGGSASSSPATRAPSGDRAGRCSSVLHGSPAWRAARPTAALPGPDAHRCSTAAQRAMNSSS